jgi:hypothetical protein
MPLKMTSARRDVAMASITDACVFVPHGATLQVQRPANLHGWSIHFTSAKNTKPRFLRASTIPSNDPAMIVITTPQI